MKRQSKHDRSKSRNGEKRIGTLTVKTGLRAGHGTEVSPEELSETRPDGTPSCFPEGTIHDIW